MDLDADSGSEKPFQPHPKKPLSRPFNPSLPLALDGLYPCLQNATDWEKANEPSPNLNNPANTTKSVLPSYKEDTGITSLPRLSKFILIASFLASTDPRSEDARKRAGREEGKETTRVR